MHTNVFTSHIGNDSRLHEKSNPHLLSHTSPNPKTFQIPNHPKSSHTNPTSRKQRRTLRKSYSTSHTTQHQSGHSPVPPSPIPYITYIPQLSPPHGPMSHSKTHRTNTTSRHYTSLFPAQILVPVPALASKVASSQRQYSAICAQLLPTSLPHIIPPAPTLLPPYHACPRQDKT